MTEPTTHTLNAPGAVTYDVRRNDASAEPVLLIIGSPMGAGGFVTLAGHFADRTVVTYDPRGVERSPKTDGATSPRPMSTPTTSPADHGAGRRTGGSLRHQRRRSERAGPGGQASRAGPDLRRP